MDRSFTNNVEIDALQEKRGAENRSIQMTCRMEMKKEVIISNYKNRDLFDMITRSSRTNSIQVYLVVVSLGVDTFGRFGPR
jgi:hypothetical protein